VSESIEKTLYDAILIPGGGVRDKGELPPWVKSRLDHAVKIHSTEYIIVLSAGTVYKPPPLDENGFPIFESIAAAQYLVNQGINPEAILCETSSYDTVGNAYFSRVIHVEPRGFRRLHIITSAFHMPRTKAIFEWLYGLDNQGGNYQLTFDPVPDIGIATDDLQARVDKEAESLRQFLKNTATIHTLQACHQWLFTEHAAYAFSATKKQAIGKSLNTY
jgi:uncharacterized SAM-binding protein YcdF (DUF218 family)